MSNDAARDPQELERLLVQRQRTGDIEGMMVLYEPTAIVDCGGARLLRGLDQIRTYFTDAINAGRKFEIGTQQPALIAGNLALTSTRFADGSVTAEVARQQPDGTWLWIIDRFRIN